MANIKSFVKYLLETPDANTRFALLLSVVVCCMSIFTLTVGFLFIPEKALFPAMVTSIGGVLGFGALIGRAAVRWAGSTKDTTTTAAEGTNKDSVQ